MVRRRAGLFHAGVVIDKPLRVEQAEASEENVRDVTDQIRSRLLLLKNQAVDLAES